MPRDTDPSPASLEAARKLFGDLRPYAGPTLEDVALALEDYARAAVEKEREECAVLMEGGTQPPGTFSAGEAGLCRLVDHAQDLCDCGERAAAIRSRGRAQSKAEGEEAKRG